jgi:hypothetical protein
VDAHGSQSVPDDSAVDLIPIADQVARGKYLRKPACCQRTRVSGWIIVMDFSTDGNHRYSWTKNKRSPFVRWTRPRTFRRNMIS